MTFARRLSLGAAAAIVAAMPANAAVTPATADPNAGSLYLQCDGQPNNMTTGESAARLLGAVTLLGLFAPPPESSDPSKRKFGAEGVTACTALIEGEKKEGDPARRIGLILARGLHEIEAKNYSAAVADAALARREAEAAGLMADPYYARSRGLAFNRLEGAALLRMGRGPEARELTLRDLEPVKHSVFDLIGVPNYGFAARSASDAELAYLGWRSRAGSLFAADQANRLEELGRFAEAAHARDALMDFDRADNPETRSSLPIAQAAVSNALAGNKALAAQQAADARANFDKRKVAGKPEKTAAEFVEVMDLYAIIDTFESGDAKAARRLFAARSQWVTASFGSVLEVNRRLREGAAPDELIGGLAHDPDQMWKDRADAKMAEILTQDADNKTLFQMIPFASAATGYEAVSKNVWRTDKSRLLVKTKAKGKEAEATPFEFLFLYAAGPRVQAEAYALHAALLAKSRGHQGFVIMPIAAGNLFVANILTGDRGAPGLPDALFNDADTVIADLQQFIPDPPTLSARRAKR